MPQYVDVHAMNLGELETDVLRKLWVDTNEDANGFPNAAAYAKYTQYRVRKKINKNYSELVALTRAIRSWFIITLTANYTQYPVPLNCFDIDEVFYFTSATSYSKLEVYEESLIEEQLSPGWRTVSGVPQYAYAANRNRMEVKLGVAPAPSASGTAITLGTGVYAKDRPFGAIEAVFGTAKAGSATTVYIDTTGQDFSALGVMVGQTLLNVTDGSKGVITTITTTTKTNDTLTCASLSGGTLNVWSTSDVMRVLGGEYGGLITIGAVEAEYILSPTVGRLPSPGITMAAGNLLVRGYMLPMLLRSEYQYPELSPMFHHGIALGAAADLGMEEPVDSPEFAQAQAYRQDFNASIAALSTFAAMQYKSNFQLWSKRS